MLVIFNIIYVNLCDCKLSPSPGGNYRYAHIENCIYINVIVFYFENPAVFYWGRAKFNNFFYLLALYMLVHVNKF